MSNKQILGALAILIVLAVLAGMWVSKTEPRDTTPTAGDKSAILGGSLESTGDYRYKEQAPGYTIEARYPAQVPSFSAEASAKVVAAVETSVAARIGEFKTNAATMLSADELARLQQMGTSYALGLDYKGFAAPGHYSYWYTVYEDTGGAHPNAYFFTHVFNAEGDEVKLADLLKNNPNWVEDLSALVSKDVVAQYKARAEVDDVTGLIFAEGLAPKEENFANWYLEGADLVIQIPPYQAAAWAAGSFEVHIPLSEVNQ
jgi:hypothetical protein